MKFKHIAENFKGFKKYDIDGLWKEIMSGKNFIYQNTNLLLEGNKAIIYVDDNSILMALKMQEKTLMNNISNHLSNITEIEFRMTNKITKIDKGKKFKIQNNSDNKLKKDLSKEIEQIIKKTHEKYKNIENELTRKIYIGYTIQREIENLKNKVNKAVKCEQCKEFFERVEKEKVCILCRNRQYEKDIRFIKEKIYKNPEITKEYAKEIYGISEGIYGLAISQILDEKMRDIYYKIEINLENQVIDLSSELETYAKYYAGTLDRGTLEIVIKKLKARLITNTLKIHNKAVKIKG
ncbi:RING finger protein [Oceanivirga salmonicida]|uniref:hypothetical protein n=1 Tax=Oceanivirga salmonicida TaxID=1769291 RepID=UPI0012E0F8FE|nr:hypothetical protein [Oceanivirga salmonicida]